MTEREALNAAITLYWDHGRPIDEIKVRLYEEFQVRPKSVERVVSNLGRVIAKFDSDLSADYVIGRIEETVL